MSLPSSSAVRMLACASLCAAVISAQQVRAVAGLGVLGGAQDSASDPSEDDPGQRVEMFENPHLDRYLERAQMFLDRNDYTAAIEVLQDVIEGRTVEVFATRSEETGPDGPEGDGTNDPTRTGKPGSSSTGTGKQADPKKKGYQAPENSELDARNAVFSRDGRIYRPVRRLCHELLARMPDVGIQISRTAHEFAAEELLTEALRTGSAQSLEQVANRYFVTLPAGRAMMLLADRLMHEGRYRASVQVLRDLLEIYPEQNRKALGISELWCEFKIAVCLQLAGERDAAQAAVQELASEHAEESLRIRGQLESIRELPNNQLFVRDTVAIETVSDRTDGITLLHPDTSDLVAMWQYRFRNEVPYKDPKPSNNNRNIWINGASRSLTMPFANRYGPGTRVLFTHEREGNYSMPRAVFLEHYRLRLADAASGVLLAEGDGAQEPPIARQNHPRVRIAASDYALLRTIEDDERRYIIIGHESNTTTTKAALKASKLIAYDKQTGKRAWASEDWLDGASGLRDVTFLAAPTVFGERLLLPSLRKDAYTLECIDRKTGEPLWHTLLHAGGSPFFKAPGCPVTVQGGIAFVATNAGCLAAVDAFAGDLRWIRRYERHDAAHKLFKRKKVTNTGRRSFRGYPTQFKPAVLDSFMPSDLVIHGGLIILAPCDGEVLLAVEAATGEPAWMLDGHTRYAPYGHLREIIGHNDKHLFALSESHIVCIELAGGLLRWQQKLPSWSGPKYSGRGRSAIVGNTIIVPNSRDLLLFDSNNASPMRRLRLPAFDESREPLAGSCHIVVEGPWLAVGYQGGVEVFSTKSALGALANNTEDPLRKAFYLTKSGARPSAEQVLVKMIQTCKDENLRQRAGSQLLALVNTRASELARAGDLAAALVAMQSMRELLFDRTVRLNWHLARIEICKEAGDMRAHETEQQSLYDYMEGRG